MRAMWVGLALFGGLSLHAFPAFAQDREVVVVTGSMIQSDDAYEDEFGALPYISIRVPADFVIFTVDLESATKNYGDREKELERTFAGLAQKIARTQGVMMEVGSPGRSSALETTAAREAIHTYGERSAISVVLKFAVKPGETFPAVRTRAEAFIASIEVNGRAEATAGSDQFIGVNDPAKHREDLMRKIAADIRLLQQIFAETPGGPSPAMSLTGLSARVKSRPIGPLELEMFVPYNIVLGAPLPQPPPRQ
ncbi:MAG: hypothetical protein QM773_15090 [Hyphomonadaceae bacterium]